MAVRVANATGNMSNGSIWDKVVNTPTIHATTNLTNVTGTTRVTAGFTAPNLVNACTGVLLYAAGTMTPNVTVTLQQAGVDTAASVTINGSLINGAGWYYFRFPTPYTFASLTASTYRFKIQATAASGQWAADAAGTAVAFLATDNETGALGATDDIWVVSPNSATPITVTVDGTQSLGSSGVPVAAARAVNCAVNVWQPSSVLAMDTAASSQLTIAGTTVTGYFGDFQAGTLVTPYPSGQTATIIIANTVDGQFGITTALNGALTLQGQPLTNWKSTYVSGTGIAADPLITAGDIGSVGDAVVIAGTTTGNQSEERYIITKNSSTSYVLSTTSGGSEVALTNTHNAGADIVNIQRNVIVKAATSSLGFFINNNAAATTTIFNMKWVRVDNTQNGTGISMTSSTNSTGTGALDYVVCYKPRSIGVQFAQVKNSGTYTGVVVFGGNGTQAALSLTNNANNKIFNDFFIIGNRRNGIAMAAFNTTFNRLVLANNNYDQQATAYGASLGVGQVTISNSNIYANGNLALNPIGITDSSIVNTSIGVVGANNNVAINPATDTYNTIVVSNCNIGDTTPLANYLNLIPGSKIAFENLSGVAYNNLVYTQNGTLRATGAGLTDTTVRSGTTGEHSVRLDSETTDGRSLTFDIAATPNETVLVTGYIWENATFVADGSASVIVELYLPGKTVGVDAPDVTKTMTKTTSSSSTDAAFTLAAFYSGSIYDVATVRIRAITTTAGASAYVGSINQGGSPATKFNIWRDGSPIDFMPEALGDAQTIAAAVWNYLTSQATTPGTFGKVTKDGADNAELAAIT